MAYKTDSSVKGRPTALVPAFLYSIYLTLYKTDIRLLDGRRDNNDLNQVIVSWGFSENKGLGGVSVQSCGLIKPGPSCSKAD